MFATDVLAEAVAAKEAGELVYAEILALLLTNARIVFAAVIVTTAREELLMFVFFLMLSRNLGSGLVAHLLFDYGGGGLKVGRLLGLFECEMSSL